MLHVACPNVTSLYVCCIINPHGYVSEELAVLAETRRLKRITLTNVAIEKQDDLLAVVRSNVALEELILTSTIDSRGPSVKDILAAGPNLQHLGVLESHSNDFYSCLYGDGTLALKAHPSLLTLTFCDMPLESKHLDQIESYLGKVEKIEFGNSLGGVTPQRFHEFVKAMPHLRQASRLQNAWSLNHPDWIAAKEIIRGRNPIGTQFNSRGNIIHESIIEDNNSSTGPPRWFEVSKPGSSEKSLS